MNTEDLSARSMSRPVLVGMGLVIIAALGFASKGIFIKLAYALDEDIDAISIMAIRMLLSLPFFLFMAIQTTRRHRQPGLTSQDVIAVLVLGFLGYYLSSFLDFSGLAYISASLERMILYLYPTLVVIITAMISKRKISRTERNALIVAYLGILLMFVSNQTGIGKNLLIGSVFVFASACSFAIFMVGSHGVIKRIGSVRFTSYSMTIAVLLTLIHYSVQHGMQLFSLTMPFYIIGLVLAIFCTVLPSYMMNAGIHRIGASRTAMVSAAGPVMTLILANIVLNETLSLLQLAGMALILVSIYFVAKK